MSILDSTLLEILLVKLPVYDRQRLLSTAHLDKYLPYTFNRKALAAAVKMCGLVEACVTLYPRTCNLEPKRKFGEMPEAFLDRCNREVCVVLLDKNHAWPDGTHWVNAKMAQESRAFLLNVASVVGMQPMLQDVAKWFFYRSHEPMPEPHSPSYSD